MSWKLLKKQDLEAFLSQLSSQAELFITRRENDRWKFKKYEPDTETEFPANLIDESLKSYFFPKRRPIATFDLQKKWSMQPVDAEKQPRIIMGLHACDAAGIEFLDRVFMLNDYKDDLYAAERQRTVLIGHICREMGEFCHCTDRGIQPDQSSGFDVIFAETDEGLLFSAITVKGEKILDSELLHNTDELPPQKKWQKDRYPVSEPKHILSTYDDDIWKHLSDICLTCGSCTFECPTCTCFLISDEKFRGKGERITVCDSCQNRSYSRMAGGHNPRSQNLDRVRNRTLDKFGYSFQKYGTISCVGCGRCVIHCPLQRSFPQIACELSDHIQQKNSKEVK